MDALIFPSGYDYIYLQHFLCLPNEQYLIIMKQSEGSAEKATQSTFEEHINLSLET